MGLTLREVKGQKLTHEEADNNLTYLRDQINTKSDSDDARFPTEGEKEALSGSSGTPSDENKFVTESDPVLYIIDGGEY